MAGEKVLIVMGSKSDLDTMKEAKGALEKLGIPCAMRIASAHRTPDEAARLAREAAAKGVKVLIAGAGYAAHLAGALAAQTVLPVIGVPLEGSSFNGLDSLLSTVQMPAGMPVATVTVGVAGARNAGILAAQMLAISDPALAKKIADMRKKMAEKVRHDDKELG